MDTSTQAAPGYYIWELPGKPVVVHLLLDVIDRLLAEVMRGFGAVPKRGAEVGGVLLGSIERDSADSAQGQGTVVLIEDFEPVEGGYTRGPSYLFSEEEREIFEDSCARWQPDASRASYAVGYYRSHTRSGM